jgi:hypothetical protein
MNNVVTMKTKKIIRKSTPKRLAFTVSTSEQKELEYEKDFSKWANNQAKYLGRREFEKLDIENLMEEILDLGKREKQMLTSYLENLLMHLLKVEFQPQKRTNSWDNSIELASYKAQKILDENPSLKPKLKEIIKEAYFSARLLAASETTLKKEIFPEECPWPLKKIFPNLEAKYSY